jgi:hypothetical protein
MHGQQNVRNMQHNQNSYGKMGDEGMYNNQRMDMNMGNNNYREGGHK